MRGLQAVVVLLGACGGDGEQLPDLGQEGVDAAVALDLVDWEEPDMARSCQQPRTGAEAAALADKFQRDFLGAVCDREVQCGHIAAAEQVRCVDVATGYLPLGYSIPDGVAAGRLGFSPEAAAECLDRWRALDCDPRESRWDLFAADSPAPAHASPYGFARTPVEAVASWCPCVLRALTPDGDRCRDSGECLYGFCNGATCGHEGTCEHLAPLPHAGEACSFGRCRSTDFCDGTNHCRARGIPGDPCPTGAASCREGLSCVNGACLRPGRLGEPCTAGCALGLFCDGEAPGHCKPLLPVGAVCPGGPSCVGRAACSDGMCTPWADLGSTTGPCPRDTLRSRDGAACETASYLEGGPCGPQGEDVWRRCAGTLHCDPVSKRCLRPLPPGDLCVQDPDTNPCYVGTCDGATGRCLVVCG